MPKLSILSSGLCCDRIYIIRVLPTPTYHTHRPPHTHTHRMKRLLCGTHTGPSCTHQAPHLKSLSSTSPTPTTSSIWLTTTLWPAAVSSKCCTMCWRERGNPVDHLINSENKLSRILCIAFSHFPIFSQHNTPVCCIHIYDGRLLFIIFYLIFFLYSLLYTWLYT